MAFEWSLWYVFVLEPHFLSIVYVIVSQKKKKKNLIIIITIIIE